MKNRIAVTAKGHVVLGLACGAVLCFVAACGSKETGKTALLPEVTVVRPTVKAVTDYLDFTGSVQAFETVELKARVSGFLTNVAFKDGALVKKGDPLFEIEPEPYIAKLALAESAVAAAEAELQRATLEYHRLENLVKQRAVAVSEVEKAKADLDTAKAKLDQAKSQVVLAKLQVGYARITAPFDGRMDRKLHDVGNLVGVSEPTLLSTIYRLDPIYTYFSINEKDLVRVRKPMKEGEERVIFAGFEGEEGYPHKGAIDFGSSSLDSTTGTLLLRGVFSNPPFGELPKIIPGMFAKLRVPVNKRDSAVLVPERALGVDQSGRFVLVVRSDGTVDKKSVKVGAAVEQLRVVEEGLTGEEQVVVSGLQQARPGSKVKALLAPADNAAADTSASSVVPG